MVAVLLLDSGQDRGNAVEGVRFNMGSSHLRGSRGFVKKLPDKFCMITVCVCVSRSYNISQSARFRH